MPDSDANLSPRENPGNSPLQDFVDYCESEFERRINSGVDFDEAQYRKAMSLVTDKLAKLETEGAK